MLVNRPYIECHNVNHMAHVTGLFCSMLVGEYFKYPQDCNYRWWFHRCLGIFIPVGWGNDAIFDEQHMVQVGSK